MAFRKYCFVAAVGHCPTPLGQHAHRVRAGVADAVRAIASASKNPPRLLSGLSESSERITAQVAREFGWPVDALLPAPPEDTLKGLGEDDARGLEAWLAAVDNVVTLEPPGEAADAEPAARLVDALVERADVVLVVWDGAPAAGPDGALDVVEKALEKGLAVVWVSADATASPKVLKSLEVPPEAADIKTLTLR